VKHVRKVFE